MASGGGGGGGGAVKMQTEEMDSTPAAGQLAALQYEEVLAAGLAFFDRIEASVDTAYSGAAAQRDLDALLGKVDELEKTIESEMLQHLTVGNLEAFKSLTLPATVRAERAKLEGELYGVQRSANAAAARAVNHKSLQVQKQAQQQQQQQQQQPPLLLDSATQKRGQPGQQRRPAVAPAAQRNLEQQRQLQQRRQQPHQ